MITVRKIIFPNLGEIPSEQSYVLVGANGSGKSHLGAWIEQHNNNVLRISAQRALTIPDTIKITNAEASWNKIYAGYEQSTNKVNKWGQDKHTSTLINDYESVLSHVFSKESHELRVFKDTCYNEGLPDRYKTIVDKIVDIWNSILPQRAIILDNFEAKAKNGEEQYRAGAMSDGERVCLYLIALCLITPNNYTIVIDEPVIHLHTSIMKMLWDRIEEYCPDKTFVYITHDLKFATSRKNATKIWTKSFDGKGSWELSVINNTDVPEELFIEILGTRTPILFVEGDTSSHDVSLYREVFEDYHVIPCSNCQKVIELTKAFNSEAVKQLHSYEVKGIIDRDFLTDVEIEAYKHQNIFATEVSEVENLYLIEPLIRLVARQIGQNEDEIFSKVKASLLEDLEKNKTRVVNAFCEKEIQYKLKNFSSDATMEEDFNHDIQMFLDSIDVHKMYNSILSKVTDILTNNDYESLIRIYNNKGLCCRVGGMIGLKANYPNVILGLLKGEKRTEIIEAIKSYLPSL